MARVVSRKRKSPRRKYSKRVVIRKRKSPRRKYSKRVVIRKRKSPKRNSPKRNSPKRNSPKRNSPKRKSPKRNSPKRNSPKRNSPKRNPPKLNSPMHQSSNINREFPVEKSNKINIDQLREIHVHWDDFGSGDAMDVNRMELSIDDEVNSLINNFYIRLGNRLDQQPGSIEDNIMAVIPEGPLRDEMITVTQLTRNDNTPHYMIYGDYFSRIVDRLIPRFSEKLFIGIYKEMRDANTTVLSLPIWQKSLDNTSPYRDVYNNL